MTFAQFRAGRRGEATHTCAWIPVRLPTTSLGRSSPAGHICRRRLRPQKGHAFFRDGWCRRTITRRSHSSLKVPRRRSIEQAERVGRWSGLCVTSTTSFYFFNRYNQNLTAVIEKENKMAGNSRTNKLKKPEMTLKERRAIKRKNLLEDSISKRKSVSR